MKIARKFLQLPAKRRLLLAEACVYLIGARIRTAAVPFRTIAPALGAAMTDSEPSLRPEQQAIAGDIAATIDQAARHLPFKLLCLQQAIAAKRMLTRRGIPGTLYLGTQRDPDGQLQAHAWLRSGVIRVTGGSGTEHTILSRFT